MSQPSIRTVAAAAGVSVATVVRVLNGNQRVTREIRARVEAAIARLGYRRNAIASDIMRRFRTQHGVAMRGVLALLSDEPRARWSEPGNYFYPEIVAGAEARARMLGFQIEVFWLHNPGVGLARLASILEARGIQGVALLPMPRLIERIEFPWEKFAAVKIGYMLQQPLPCVATDYLHHFDVILDRLRRCGYRRVGYMIDERLERSRARLVEARYLLHTRELAPREAVPLFLDSPFGQRDDPRPFLAWYRRHRPEAVICHDTGPYFWLRGQGVRLPADVGCAAITTHADHREVSGMLSALGSLGAAAVDTLSQQILHQDPLHPAAQRTVVIAGTWNEGTSLRPPHDGQPG